MPREEFEPKIPVFERFKTIRALNCVATGTGISNILKAASLFEKIVYNTNVTVKHFVTELSQYRAVIFDALIVPQMIKKLPHFMDPKVQHRVH
jgi:hypothetical protein